MNSSYFIQLPTISQSDIPLRNTTAGEFALKYCHRSSRQLHYVKDTQDLPVFCFGVAHKLEDLSLKVGREMNQESGRWESLGGAEEKEAKLKRQPEAR